MEAGTAAGSWFANRVARAIPQPLLFAAIWVVGLHEVVSGEYIYSVTHLDAAEGDAPILLVRLAANFESWKVARLQ